MGCNHINCGSKEKIWLNYTYHGLERGLKPHLYCKHCGAIKSESSCKPRRFGYYINIIAEIAKEFKITKVQIRLISVELQRSGFDDFYSMDNSIQEKIFIETVRKYVNLPEQAIKQFL